ncbi:hypothetical protein IWQ62_005777 [Dispira parvispora]|uniref:Uncharacterized protein n=1 Tax=Dispira parvispora TaxID=1520584 RepID=A0A9W8E4X5_9FUNG|nr:hypothetical protein IWQ62_005777 [Dispira parvispora]
MSSDKGDKKTGGGIASKQKSAKLDELDRSRMARSSRSSVRGRGRANKRRRRSSSSATPSPSTSPGPSHSCGDPITNTANFSEKHMDELHIKHKLNCPIEEIVPLEHCPEDLLHRMRAFWALSREDLLDRNAEKLLAATDEARDGSNRHLDGLIVSSVLLSVSAIMNLTQKYADDYMYGLESDDERVHWSVRVTANCVDILCFMFLSDFTELNTGKYPMWEYCEMTWDAKVLPERYNFTVRPDRVIHYAQSKRQRTPFAWVNINPYYLAPTMRLYESTLPQVAAQTIAMTRYHPREVFGIEFSYRYVTFWRAVIPDNYLELIKGSGDLPSDVFVEMKRSTVLDLEQPDGRYEFSRALLALLMYWNKQVSGNE